MAEEYDSSLKSIAPLPVTSHVGTVILREYEIIEVLTGTHQLFRCKSTKMREQSGRPREVVFKFFCSQCFPEHNVLHEKQVFEWLRTIRNVEVFKRIVAPLPIAVPSAVRALAFPPFQMSLAQVRKDIGTLTQKVTLKMGMEMLAAVRELHSIGILHQNITLNHFLVMKHFSVKNSKYGIQLCDLSQAKPFIFYEEELPLSLALLKPKPHLHFSSLDVQDQLAGTRRDDLISWFYCMVALREQLVWEDCDEDRFDIIRIRKNGWMKNPLLMSAVFCKAVARHVSELFAFISSLSQRERPRYDMYGALLLKALFALDGKELPKIEELPIYMEFTREELVETTITPVFKEDVFKKVYDEFKYDAAYYFERTESKVNPRLRKELGPLLAMEKYKPYDLSEDEKIKESSLAKRKVSIYKRKERKKKDREEERQKRQARKHRKKDCRKASPPSTEDNGVKSLIDGLAETPPERKAAEKFDQSKTDKKIKRKSRAKLR